MSGISDLVDLVGLPCGGGGINPVLTLFGTESDCAVLFWSMIKG